MATSRPAPSLLAAAALVVLLAGARGDALGPQTTKAGGVTPLDGLTAQEREMLGLANDFAARCSRALERWMASGETTEDRLFSFLYFPIPKTDPPKYTTAWDALADRDILAIEEDVLGRSPVIAYTVMVDKNGYLPTHNRRYSQPLTGNAASDLVNNRTKRIFNDRTGVTAARSETSFLIQQYQRDTGELMSDISVPLIIRGKHWGAVRIGYRPVEEH